MRAHERRAAASEAEGRPTQGRTHRWRGSEWNIESVPSHPPRRRDVPTPRLEAGRVGRRTRLRGCSARGRSEWRPRSHALAYRRRGRGAVRQCAWPRVAPRRCASPCARGRRAVLSDRCVHHCDWRSHTRLWCVAAGARVTMQWRGGLPAVETTRVEVKPSACSKLQQRSLPTARALTIVRGTTRARRSRAPRPRAHPRLQRRARGAQRQRRAARASRPPRRTASATIGGGERAA